MYFFELWSKIITMKAQLQVSIFRLILEIKLVEVCSRDATSRMWYWNKTPICQNGITKKILPQKQKTMASQSLVFCLRYADRIPTLPSCGNVAAAVLLFVDSAAYTRIDEVIYDLTDNNRLDSGQWLLRWWSFTHTHSSSLRGPMW